MEVSAQLERIAEFRKRLPPCPDNRFQKQVVNEWFDKIAPERTRMYGTTSLYRYGPQGVAIQILNCYWRWSELLKQDSIEANLSRRDTIIDTFGFSVLLGVVMEVKYEMEGVWEEGDPVLLLVRSIEEVFHAREYESISPYASAKGIQLAVMMWTLELKE